MEQTQTRQVARDSAYAALRDAIVSWRLLPGERVAEVDAARSLGLSRTPTREALHRLEAERLVVRNPGGQTAVSPISEEDVTNTYDVRVALEQVAIRAACALIQDEGLFVVEQALHGMQLAVQTGHPKLVGEYGRQFHGAIHRASRNQACISLLTQLQPHVDRYRTLTTLSDSERPIRAVQEHEVLFDALRDRDPERCSTLIADHLRSGELIALRVLRGLRGQPIETIAARIMAEAQR